MIAQIFILNVQLALPTGTPTNEANAEIETQPLTVESYIILYIILLFSL